MYVVFPQLSPQCSSEIRFGLGTSLPEPLGQLILEVLAVQTVAPVATQKEKHARHCGRALYIVASSPLLVVIAIKYTLAALPSSLIVGEVRGVV